MDAYVKASRRRRSLYDSKKRHVLNRIAALGVLVGDEVASELGTMVDDAFQMFGSCHDIDGLQPVPDEATELATCAAYISKIDDKEDEDRFSAVIQARKEALRQSNDASNSTSHLQGAEAMLGYIYPDVVDDTVRKEGLMKKFASSRSGSIQE